MHIFHFCLIELIKNSSIVMQISKEFANHPRYVNKVTLKQVSEEVENTDFIMKYLVKFQEKQTILVVKNIEQIEKTNLSAHISGDLYETQKFTLISHEIKRLIEEDKKANVDANPMEIPFSPFSGEGKCLFRKYDMKKQDPIFYEETGTNFPSDS